jgi:hypothetical protein
LDVRKVEEGDSGLESAGIWELRNRSLRSMIVGAEEVIWTSMRYRVGSEVVLRCG